MDVAVNKEQEPMSIALKLRHVLSGLLSIVVLGATVCAGGEKALTVAEEIRNEAVLPNNSEAGHPLPLAAHWNAARYAGGFTPDYQLEMIEKGHHILPAFFLPAPGDTKWIGRSGYYEKAIKKASELKIPISFVSTQWERYLADSSRHLKLPAKDNPNVIDVNGTVLDKVSPFGPENLWHEVGEWWTSTQLLQQLQAYYPDPPLVLFISNNEHKKLLWHEVQKSARYLAIFGPGHDDNFKRKAVGDGWIKRYRALQQGMKEGLIATMWKDNAMFIGYNAFGTGAFARWKDWLRYSLYTTGRIEPWPLAWDGASVSYYVNNWNSGTDYTVMSPQIEAMNWVFMQGEALRLNPGFWFEMSTWDGHEPSKENDKRKYYTALGQVYSPDRYEGFIQFGMWLLRPRVVREFRGDRSDLSQDEPYFLAVVKSVDRVHNNLTLKKFWRRGRLVSNDDHLHPYQKNIPSEYNNVARWFLLDTDLDPKRPWALDTAIPVFSLGLVIGAKPNREWLVYAYSPLRNYSGVRIVLSDSEPFKVNASPNGIFCHVIENNGINKIIQLNN
jgi:hypothetical protein